jgi:hypothetical protein
MKLGKKLSKLICSVGILSSLFGMSNISANEAELNQIVLTQDMGQQISSERLLINNDNDSNNLNSMYHYSHSSHASHASHASHSSHYSSTYDG